MEQVLQIIMLIILLGFIIRISLWHWTAVAAIALVYGLLALLMVPYAAAQSKTQLHELLQNPTLMLNISLWISIEAVLAIGYCFSAIHPNPTRRPWVVALLQWYPSLIVLPILLYILTQAIFSLTGMAFSAIGHWVAISTALGIVGLALGIQALIPERTLRLEVLFMCWTLALLLGVVATVNGQPMVQGSTQLFILPMLAIVGLAALLIAFGYWLAMRRRRGAKPELPMALDNDLLNRQN